MATGFFVPFHLSRSTESDVVALSSPQEVPDPWLDEDSSISGDAQTFGVTWKGTMCLNWIFPFLKVSFGLQSQFFSSL